LSEQDSRGFLQSGFRYAYSLTHQHHDAEDLVQEAWLKLSKSPGRVESKPLLFVTIRNLFIDQYRRKNLVVLESLESVSELSKDDNALQLALTLEEIEIAMGTLRPEEREMIYLNAVEGYTASEISDITQLSRNTILSLIHRGKIKLVEYVKNDSRPAVSK